MNVSLHSIRSFAGSVSGTGWSWLAIFWAVTACSPAVGDDDDLVALPVAQFSLLTDPPLGAPIPFERARKLIELPQIHEVASFAGSSVRDQRKLLEQVAAFVREDAFLAGVVDIGEVELPSDYAGELIRQCALTEANSVNRRRLLSILMSVKLTKEAQAQVRRLAEGDRVSELAIHARWDAGYSSQPSADELVDVIRSVQRSLVDRVRAAREWGKREKTSAAGSVQVRPLDVARSLTERFRLHQDRGDLIVAAELVASSATDSTPADAAGRTEMLVELINTDCVPARQVAFVELARVAPERAIEFAEAEIDSGDVAIRRHCIELVGRSRRPDRLTLLLRGLADPQLLNRRLATSYLLAWAKDDDLRPQVIDGLVSQLEGESWRATEQAILALVSLRHQESVPAFLALVSHFRPDVNITAAWAVKELARRPATLEKVVKILEERAEQFSSPIRGDEVVTPDDARRYAHLVEALGVNGVQDQGDLLFRYVRYGYDGLLRASALWSIGVIDGPQASPQVQAWNMQVLKGVDSEYPEVGLVIYASFLTAGRMRQEKARQILMDEGSIYQARLPFGEAATWALSKLDEPGL